MTSPSGRTLRLLTASAAVLALSGLTVGSLSSAALFTDSAAAAPAAVASGSVVLSLGGTASTSLAVTAMAPGDARYGIVSVTASGSLQSRYSGRAAWAAANALTSTLTLSVRAVPSATATCDSTLAWGAGDVATNQSAVPGQTAVALFGDVAAGAQAGDRVLDAAVTEHLCVRLALPSSAGNGVAGLSSALTLSFDAEQTAHNA